MKRNTLNYGSRGKIGEVAYIIDKNVVYFHQTAGIVSSINDEELIVEAISLKEGFHWIEYKWVDIQTKPRYSEDAQDQLIFSESKTPDIIEWIAISVPEEILKALS